MRRLIPVVAAVILAGCRAQTVEPVVTINNNVPPGGEVALGPSFAAALACEATGMSYVIQEASIPGFTSPLDGSITPGGLFGAPRCGSVYVGTVMHIVGTCTTNGRSGVAAVAIAEEVISTISVAMMILYPGTPQACIQTSNFHTPIGAEAQFYAQLVYTCSTFYTPTPPSPLPPACP